MIWEVLRDLRDQGTTVLLSSHYLEEVEALADRMAIIDAGRVTLRRLTRKPQARTRWGPGDLAGA